MKNFDSRYSAPNRLWFAEKLIRELEAEGLADATVEQKTREVIQQAKTVVKANRDFSLRLAAEGNARFTKRALQDMLKHRVEILYGAIASDRRFAEPKVPEVLALHRQTPVPHVLPNVLLGESQPPRVFQLPPPMQEGPTLARQLGCRAILGTPDPRQRRPYQARAAGGRCG